MLKLIPTDLQEEKVLKAIKEDSNLTLEMIRSNFKFENKTCNCEKGEHLKVMLIRKPNFVKHIMRYEKATILASQRLYLLTTTTEPNGIL